MTTRRGGRAGQVVVEMLLILPVFLTMVFTIMEIGYVSFQLILLNHATYEVARIGSMTYTPPPGYTCGKLNEFMQKILPAARVTCSEDVTLTDPQAGNTNKDLVVTGQHAVKLIFPISSIIMAKPKGSGTRLLLATVRMPIETPLTK